MKKTLFFIVLAIMAAVVFIASNPVMEHEIITSHAHYSRVCSKQAACDIVPVYDSIVISWDIRAAAESRHFSIERFINNDINSALIISYNFHHLHYSNYNETFYTFDIEAWHDVDGQYIQMSVKL